MKDGERQVSPTIDGIRRDHVARYEFAAKYIHDHAQRDQILVQQISESEPRMIDCQPRVIDFSCGVGYGTAILAEAGNTVRGYDIDEEALAYARQHYARNGNGFVRANGDAPGDLGEYDAAVCFETIEHIENPRPLLKALRESAPMLIASVPNEDVMPYEFEPGKVYAYHFRHYTKIEFVALLAECGWRVTEWRHQAGPDSEVSTEGPGRTLIAVCERRKDFEAVEPQGKHIAIIGLGPSLDQYTDITKRQGGRHKFCDETWAINALGDVLACDLVFHMDDVRIQEIRAKARPDSNIAAMLDWIKTSPVPVVTSRKHPDYPALVEFPLEDVLNNLGHDYFNNTAPYAIAFAIHIGATQISVFGMDYTYQNVHDAEKGRACVEFWLGQAHARGIKIHLPKSTSLMDSNCPRTARLYGYDTVDIDFNMDDEGVLNLGFTPRDKLPTAEEIERLYDHSIPISEQHLGTKE